MLLLDTDKDNFDAGTETEKGQAGVGAVAPRFPTVRSGSPLPCPLGPPLLSHPGPAASPLALHGGSRGPCLSLMLLVSLTDPQPGLTWTAQSPVKAHLLNA